MGFSGIIYINISIHETWTAGWGNNGWMINISKYRHGHKDTRALLNFCRLMILNHIVPMAHMCILYSSVSRQKIFQSPLTYLNTPSDNFWRSRRRQRETSEWRLSVGNFQALKYFRISQKTIKLGVFMNCPFSFHRSSKLIQRGRNTPLLPIRLWCCSLLNCTTAADPKNVPTFLNTFGPKFCFITQCLCCHV
jgi:hypothetical protein